MFSCLTDEKNKLALQFGTTIFDSSDLGDFSRLNDKGEKFSCHTVKTWIHKEPAEIIVNGPLSEDIVLCLEKFRTAGLFNFWKQLHRFNFARRRTLAIANNTFPWTPQKVVDSGVQIISIINLVPIFSVWLGFLGISVIFFAIEMRAVIITGVRDVKKYVADTIIHIVNIINRLRFFHVNKKILSVK